MRSPLYQHDAPASGCNEATTHWRAVLVAPETLANRPRFGELDVPAFTF